MDGQQYQQHQSMSMPQRTRTMPSSRAPAQLPYARPDIVSEDPVLPPDPTEPVIKKMGKRAASKQLAKLNAAYARTAFPSTEERTALAKELDMSARSVQIWLVHVLISSVFMVSKLWTLFSGSRTKDSRLLEQDATLLTLRPTRTLHLSPRSNPLKDLEAARDLQLKHLGAHALVLPCRL
jgi:hypothetical protein